MRIGIDARFLGPEGKGLGRYTDELVRRLPGAHPEQTYVLFLRRENWDLAPQHPAVERVLAPFPWYSIVEQLRFPPLLRSLRLDLMHFPHFNVPLIVPVPFVVTIHDLILTHFPTERASTLGPIVYRAKHRAYQFIIRSAVRRARTVLTVSQYSKREIIREFRIPADKVVVTYEAGEWSRTTGEEAPPAVALEGKLVKPFFLSVGNAYPHKNLERLIEAFALLKRAHGFDAQLVFVGKTDYFFDRLRTFASTHAEAGSVVFAGFTTDAELRWLYRHARAFVFPSLAEGFGLPPLEAMQAGLPVAASRASCIPEVLGDAALFFDPLNAQSMASAMARIARDEALRHALQERGAAQAQKYRWEDLVETTSSVYTTAVNQ